VWPEESGERREERGERRERQEARRKGNLAMYSFSIFHYPRHTHHIIIVPLKKALIFL
jgi:hypothetical protein